MADKNIFSKTNDSFFERNGTIQQMSDVVNAIKGSGVNDNGNISKATGLSQLLGMIVQFFAE